MMHIIKIIILTTLCTICLGLEELPSYLKICHESDNDLVSCMKNSVEYLRPYLKNGIESLDIPSIDPINIGDLLFAESTAGQGLQITVKDLVAYDASLFEITSINTIAYGKDYKFEMYFPKMDVVGTYNVNGKIILLPIRGSGQFTGNFTKCRTTTRVKLEKFDDEGHVRVKVMSIKIIIGTGKVKLQNLFNGDKVLGDAINDVINQNFELLSKDVTPLIERALERNLKEISNKIISRYTQEQLFPH